METTAPAPTDPIVRMKRELRSSNRKVQELEYIVTTRRHQVEDLEQRIWDLEEKAAQTIVCVNILLESLKTSENVVSAVDAAYLKTVVDSLKELIDTTEYF